jgi:hypothetical protein
MDSKLAPPFIKGETYFDREGEYVLTSIVRENIEYKRPDGQIERKDAQTKANIPQHRRPLALSHSPQRGYVLVHSRDHRKAMKDSGLHAAR